MSGSTVIRVGVYFGFSSVSVGLSFDLIKLKLEVNPVEEYHVFVIPLRLATQHHSRNTYSCYRAVFLIINVYDL